jgi:hypothetical protein
MLLYKPMNRKSFTQKLTLLGVCPLITQNLSGSDLRINPLDTDEKYKKLQSQNYIRNSSGETIQG